MSNGRPRSPREPVAERRRSEDIDLGLHEGTIRRYRDPAFDAVAVKLHPGGCYVTRQPEEMLVTVLGSCVAACIRDPFAGVGGMNHFMLPETATIRAPDAGEGFRYGNVAMDRLIEKVVARGGCRGRLEIKVFGGAHVLGCALPIGEQNADFVEAYLQRQALPIAARHLRGERARRIHYFALTGEVFMLEMRRRDDAVVFEREARTWASLLTTNRESDSR